MFSKLVYLAPIAVTTAGVTALIALRVEDERTKKILRAIAIVLFFGSFVALAQQAIEIYQIALSAQRFSAEQARLAEEERAKAAEAVARARAAEELARQAVLRAEDADRRAKLKADEEVRQARLKAEREEAEHRAAREKIEREQSEMREKENARIARERREREAEEVRRRSVAEAEEARRRATAEAELRELQRQRQQAANLAAQALIENAACKLVRAREGNAYMHVYRNQPVNYCDVCEGLPVGTTVLAGAGTAGPGLWNGRGHTCR